MTFLGHSGDRTDLARLLATADVVLAPAPLQSVGPETLEALACGTPVIARRDGALAELVGAGGGAVADGDAAAFADALLRIVSGDTAERSVAARRAPSASPGRPQSITCCARR